MEPDVVVVGGGAIGVTAAYELGRRGVRVTLLERGDSLAAGCSFGNAGIVSPSHSQPLASAAALREGLRRGQPLALRPRPRTLPWLGRFAVACRAAGHAERMLRALSAASLELHADLAALGTGFDRRGVLAVYTTSEAFDGADGDEKLAGDEAAAFEPALRRGLAGAVFHGDEAHVDPLRFVEAVAAASQAEHRTRVEVRALRPRNGGVAVETSDGDLHPQTVVLAAGAWTGRLARTAGVFVPLASGKGYHVELTAAPSDPRVPILVAESRAALTPLDARLRLTGSVELCGIDLTIRLDRVEAMRRRAESVLRDGGERKPLAVWAGLRPCAPDGLPVIGRPERAPGLIVATGHTTKGLALAPVTAQLVAELVAGEPPSHDVAPFSPDRFRPLLRRR